MYAHENDCREYVRGHDDDDRVAVNVHVYVRAHGDDQSHQRYHGLFHPVPQILLFAIRST